VSTTGPLLIDSSGIPIQAPFVCFMANLGQIGGICMAILPSAIYVPTYLAMKRYSALPARPSSSAGLVICAARIPHSPVFQDFISPPHVCRAGDPNVVSPGVSILLMVANVHRVQFWCAVSPPTSPTRSLSYLHRPLFLDPSFHSCAGQFRTERPRVQHLSRICRDDSTTSRLWIQRTSFHFGVTSHAEEKPPPVCPTRFGKRFTQVLLWQSCLMIFAHVLLLELSSRLRGGEVEIGLGSQSAKRIFRIRRLNFAFGFLLYAGATSLVTFATCKLMRALRVQIMMATRILMLFLCQCPPTVCTIDSTHAHTPRTRARAPRKSKAHISPPSDSLDNNTMLLPTTETLVHVDNPSAWRCACGSCGNLTILLISDKIYPQPTLPRRTTKSGLSSVCRGNRRNIRVC
jgi:hypothetical protein